MLVRNTLMKNVNKQQLRWFSCNEPRGNYWKEEARGLKLGASVAELPLPIVRSRGSFLPYNTTRF